MHGIQAALSALARRSIRYAAACSLVALPFRPSGAPAALTKPQRTVVEDYVRALQRHQYADAFALLTAGERRYFGSSANFASAFAADRLTIRTARIIGSRPDAPLGTIVVASERVTFYDFAHRTQAAATVTVPYGVVGRAPARIKDPYHPWRAVAPQAVSGQAGSVRITVRKLAFFTGRMETTVQFANVGAQTVTILPYGRSVVRDDGKAYVPLATRLPSLTDPTLYTGLRLAPNAEYTGLITFVTPARFTPASLTFTFGPALKDGSDTPFDIVLARYRLAADR